MEANRVKALYDQTVVPAMIKKFNYKNVNQVPKLVKITINSGLGDVKDNSKSIQLAQEELKQIAGQKPILTMAKKSVANFKVSEGQSVGFTYGSGHTYYTASTGLDDERGTADDIMNRIVFDNQGRAVSAYTISKDHHTIYGAAVGEAMPLLFIPSTLIGSFTLVLIPEISENFYKKRDFYLQRDIEKGILSEKVSTINRDE